MESLSVTTTACTVEIVTPEPVRLVFDTREAPSDLLHVQTHNDMSEACGSFTLTFAPRRILGRTYDQLIPLRSLVTIRMEAPAGRTAPEDSVVMVGLTDDHGVTEDYSRGQPQRSVTLSGRSIACVWVDAHLWYHPNLQVRPQGVLTAQDASFNLFWPNDLLPTSMDPRDVLRTLLTYFLGLKRHIAPEPLGEHLATAQQAEQVQAEKPDVSPAEAQQEVTQKRRVAARTKTAPVRQQGPLPSGELGKGQASIAFFEQLKRENPGITPKELSQRWLADQETTRGLTPEQGELGETDLHVIIEKTSPDLPPGAPGVPSPGAVGGTTNGQVAPESVVQRYNILLNLQLPEQTIADLLDMNDHTWKMFEDNLVIVTPQNHPYAGALWNHMHLYIDHLMQEFFTRMEGGVCKIFFRPKPFLMHANPTGTRFRDTDSTCDTLEFDRQTWETVYLGSSLRRQTSQVYNAFTVVPFGTSYLKDIVALQVQMVPTLLDEPTHPSYLAKYGVRFLEHRSPYLSTLSDTKTDSVVAAGQRWGAIAASWYGWAPEMYSGVMTVRGNPMWNVGHRLLYVDEQGQREGYIEGVNHEYNYQTGQYLTHLKVTRLWYLAGAIDQQGFDAPTVEVPPEAQVQGPPRPSGVRP